MHTVKQHALQPRPRRKLRLLLIGAHPADSFDNAGGTCLHHVRRGDTVTAYVLTGGARIHDEVISEQMRDANNVPEQEELEALMQERIRFKQKEVIKACALMGIEDVRFSTLDDTHFILTKELIGELATLIRGVRPHIIITHYPFDHAGLADQHGTTGKAVVHAAWDASTVLPGDTNPPWRTPQIFFMGFPGSFHATGAMGHLLRPHYDVLVDISDVVHLKQQALDMMVSQNYHGHNALKRIESVEGSAGSAAGCAYAEPFIAYRAETYHTLPLSEYMIDQTRELEKDMYDRKRFILTRDGSWDDYLARHELTEQDPSAAKE